MLQVSELVREFTFNGVKLADLGPAFTPEQIKDFYANVHPDLLNAQIEGPTTKGEKQVYEFRRAVGTKGARATAQEIERAQTAVARYSRAADSAFVLSRGQKSAAEALEDLFDVPRHGDASEHMRAPSQLVPLLP